MNREQKRKSIKLLTTKGYTTKQAETILMLKMIEETRKFLNEGDKVRLNISQIKSRPEWRSNIDQNKFRYQEWVFAHQDDILTVEYDKNHQNSPSIVCFAEDKTDPKWLFWEGDLDVVERVNG